MLSGPNRRSTPIGMAAEDVVYAISDATEVPIFVKDAAGRYLLVNRHLANLWGHSSSFVLGKSDFELFPEPTAAELREHDVAVMESRETRHYEETVEFGGVLHVYLVTKVPIFAADDSVYGICGIAMDITDMRQRERVMRESEERFRVLADSAPVLIWMSGVDKEGLFFNQSWLDFTGRTLEEELGEGWLDGVHPDDAAALEECQRAFEAQRPFQARFRMRRADGEYRWLLDTGVPRIGADGAFAGYIGSCVDIEAQIRLESQLRKEAQELTVLQKRTDEFLAMLGHELRNPLAPICNAVALLEHRQDELPADMRESVQIAGRQLGHLTSLVNELLDVARVSHGKIELQRRRIDLCRAIENAREAAKVSFSDLGLRLELELPSTQLIVDGDETRLVQVIANLLQNAAKFTPHGGKVTLSASVVSGKVEVVVADTGVGIEQDQLENVFELFYKKGPPVDGGLGIGLALVRRLVELHGGTVTCSSEGLDKGSQFRIALPLAAEQTWKESPAVRKSTTPLSQRDRLKLLIVDDNADAADTLCSLLELRGHEVRAAYDGESALKLIELHRFDVALLDLALPGISGFDVATEVLEHRETAPVLVALTGYGQPSAVQRSQHIGFQHHLLKPVKMQELDRLLKAVAHESARSDSPGAP